MNLPRLVPIRQKFRTRPLADLDVRVTAEVEKILDRHAVRAGSPVAVTAGSRGIANLPAVMKAVTRALLARDLRPFLVAAMGSHGGGTAAGKLKVLERLGITEAAVQAPLASTAKVARIGEGGDGSPLLLDEEAARAGGILLVNRVHPHPCFEGPIQSGLLKMLCIGLGNTTGAQVTHRAAIRDGMFPTLLRRGRRTLECAAVTGGLGLWENETGETAGVEGFAPEDIERGEEVLLRRSRGMRPRIPFSDLHLVIVDRMGKDLSGTGMDPKVLGRGEPSGGEPSGPRVDRIYVRSLTAASSGNAHGVGLADFVSRPLAEAIDWDATRANSLAAGAPQRSRLPLVMETDRDAVEAAFLSCGPIGPAGPRVVWIRDTGSLQQMRVSEALLEERGPQADWSVAGNPAPMAFDTAGRLVEAPSS